MLLPPDISYTPSHLEKIDDIGPPHTDVQKIDNKADVTPVLPVKRNFTAL